MRLVIVTAALALIALRAALTPLTTQVGSTRTPPASFLCHTHQGVDQKCMAALAKALIIEQSERDAASPLLHWVAPSMTACGSVVAASVSDFSPCLAHDPTTASAILFLIPPNEIQEVCAATTTDIEGTRDDVPAWNDIVRAPKGMPSAPLEQMVNPVVITNKSPPPEPQGGTAKEALDDRLNRSVLHRTKAWDAVSDSLKGATRSTRHYHPGPAGGWPLYLGR